MLSIRGRRPAKKKQQDAVFFVKTDAVFFVETDGTAVDGRSLLAEAEAGERSSSVRRSPAASLPIAWQ